MVQAFLDSPQSHPEAGSPSASASAPLNPPARPPTIHIHSQTAPRPPSKNRETRRPHSVVKCWLPPRCLAQKLRQRFFHSLALLQTAPPPPTPLPFQSTTPPPKHASSPTQAPPTPEALAPSISPPHVPASTPLAQSTPPPPASRQTTTRQSPARSRIFGKPTRGFRPTRPTAK